MIAVSLATVVLHGCRMNKTSIGFAALTVAWNVIGAGVGEEAFFRGFVQSHLNRVCGRPWRIWGIDFGPGLIASALLFGLVHALNTVDYFHGRWTFASGVWRRRIFSSGLVTAHSVERDREASCPESIVTCHLFNVWLRVPEASRDGNDQSRIYIRLNRSSNAAWERRASSSGTDKFEPISPWIRRSAAKDGGGPGRVSVTNRQECRRSRVRFCGQGCQKRWRSRATLGSMAITKCCPCNE